MAQQTINIGTAPDDGTGDTLRDAFDKTNDNFDELYSFDALSWTRLATTWDTPPTLNSVVTMPAPGSIYEYTLDTVTRYRFVPTTYSAAQDAFYGEVGLTTLIVART